MAASKGLLKNSFERNYIKNTIFFVCCQGNRRFIPFTLWTDRESSGDNANDGLSPETAWATLDRAFETYWPLTRDLLKPGDTVLLERGGTWHVSPDEREGLTSDAYNIVEGVTLGAYGEGARPAIRGDISEANAHVR